MDLHDTLPMCENFLKILAYVKSMTDDYIALVNGTVYGKIQIDVANIARTVRICSCADGAFVDFNYMGTPRISPKRMTAKFNGNEIVITASSKEGINDLMNSWKYLKPEYQKKIDETCSKNCKEIVRNQDHLAYLLENAKKFEV